MLENIWFWAFFLSLSINIFGGFYVRWLLGFITKTNEDLKILYELISQFSSHVKSIYELEMFYGDQTLQSLLNHGTELLEKIEQIDIIVEEEDPE